MGHSMIDWDRVDDLREEIGEEDFGEVVELFLEEVEEVVERLTNAPVVSALEEDMHFLKGSALNLGFASFASLCEKGEAAAREGQGDTIDLPTVISAFQTTKGEFLANGTHRPA